MIRNLSADMRTIDEELRDACHCGVLRRVKGLLTRCSVFDDDPESNDSGDSTSAIQRQARVNVNAFDTLHWGPLMIIAEFLAPDDESNQLQIAKMLLDYGFLPNAQTPEGVSALHLCAKKGNLALSTLLLEKGANPNLQYNDGRSGDREKYIHKSSSSH